MGHHGGFPKDVAINIVTMMTVMTIIWFPMADHVRIPWRIHQMLRSALFQPLLFELNNCTV